METRSQTDRLFAAFQRTGDPRALGEVYDRVAPELLRVALHTTGDLTEAEDVLQATFVVAIQEAGRFDSRRRVLPWLVGILALEAKKARERGGRRPEPERLPPRATPKPAEAAERAELLAQLDAAVERIPAAFRPVLRLRLRHDLSVAEIAEALERSPGTVRSQLARGTESLRRALPAGLAHGLVVLGAPARGLEGVRAAVIQQAAQFGPATAASLGTTSFLAGFLAMKKLVALAAGLVLALSLVLVQRASKASARPTQPAAETARLEAPPVVAPTRDEPLLQESLAREAVAAPPAPMKPNVEEARATELWVRAAWPDGTPAAEEVVLVRDGQSVGLDDAWEARTDPDGVARFLGLAPGSAYVSLLRGGETSTQLAVGETATVELTLRVGMTVVGSVFDDLGRPVPAAEVWLSKLYRTNVGHVVTRSDEAGRFEVRSVTRDHSIGVRKAGFAPSGLRRLSGKSGDRRELAFRLDQTGARVRGRVLDPGGAPFLRAQVLIGTEHPESLRIEDGSFAPAPPPQRARTDEQGRFELECVPLGLQPVQVRAPGHAPFLGEIEVLEDDRNELVVTLQGAPRVVGRVRGPSGTPLEAVWIRSSAAEDFASSSTWSRLDGSFVLSDLAIGPQTLLAQHTEHGEARLELRLSAGETREWEFELRPVPRIHGRLLDRRGAPLADLVVVALHDEDRTQRARSDPSDADGLFVLPNLEERPYLLWVQPPAQEGGWRVFPFVEEIDVWPSVAPIEITVPDASERGRLMAEIVALDGSPLVGAELQLWHQEARQWRAYGAGGERATVDVESIPPGTLDLEVRHPDHPWKRLGSRRLDAGATLDLGRIVLEPSGRLRVRLGGLAEQEYESLHALLSDASNRESGVATLAPGWLTTSPLQTGEHVLVLGGDGVRQVRLSFRIEEGVETELELRLEPCGSREVILELPAGASASWLQASLHEPGGALVWGGAVDRSGERPRVRVSAPPGPYRLVVSGTGGWHGESELVLGARGSTLPPLSILLRRDP